MFAKYWEIETLKPMIDSRTAREYNENRKHIIEAQYKTILNKMHRIEIANEGDLIKAI